MPDWHRLAGWQRGTVVANVPVSSRRLLKDSDVDGRAHVVLDPENVGAVQLVAAAIITEQLHQAIRANPPAVVQECLETGADPNRSPKLPPFPEGGRDDTDEDAWFYRSGSD